MEYQITFPSGMTFLSSRPINHLWTARL